MSITIRIALITLTILAALGIGLLLRRALVNRLKRTVLDNWLIQTLGVVVVTFIVAISIPLATFIWNIDLLFQFLNYIGREVGISGLTTFFVRVSSTLLLIGLGIGVARTIRALAVRGLGQNRVDINIRIFIGRIFYFIILILAVLWVLSLWEIPLTPLVTGLGVFTVALTVSIQDILKDLVAGFYILIERPFHIGDQISTTNSVSTYTGRVEDVQIRATKLRLVSGEEMTIPNSMVFGNVVINNTFYGERRATISISLPEGNFVKGETASQVLKALEGLEQVMTKPEPKVSLSGYTSKGVILTLRFWLGSKQAEAVPEVMHTLHELLPGAELSVTESAGDV